MLRTRLAERMQDLLLENDVLEDFLGQLSDARRRLPQLKPGRPVLCSARVVRRPGR